MQKTVTFIRLSDVYNGGQFFSQYSTMFSSAAARLFYYPLRIIAVAPSDGATN